MSAEPVAPVVAVAAILRLAADQVQLAGVRADAQVVPAQVHDLARFQRFHAAAAVAVGEIEPVVQPPHRPIDPVLLVAFDKSRVKDLLCLPVRLAVGAGLHVEDVRGIHHDGPLAPGQHAGWERQIVEKHRRLVVLSVALRRFEHHDLTARLPLAVHAERIIAHLDHPELAVRPPGHRDGVLHQRLGDDQLRRKPGPSLQTAQRRLRRFGGWLDVHQQVVE